MVRLAAFVHLRDTSGLNHWFGPEDEVPDWAAEQISNPDVWAWDAEPTPAGPPPEPEQPGDDEGQADDGQAHEGDEGQGGDGDRELGATRRAEPPRSGRGSSIEAWTDYARQLGLEVHPDMTRDDIIELVDQDGG